MAEVMSTTVKGDVDITRLPVDSEEHQFEKWTVNYSRSHILHSTCSSTDVCSDDPASLCLFCRYSQELDLPHMPDMVFPSNVLALAHSTSCRIQFNALDALKPVSNGKLSVKVACSEAWKHSRQDTGLVDKQVLPFDWTFTTDYRGTLTGQWTVENPTNERIDLDRLRQQEKILFYNDLTLFEDELHDNGVAACSVKIRVMPSSFFVLLRYFLRVDNVMLRVNDTRIFHDFSTNYVLREFTNRESKVADLKMPTSLMTDPNTIAPLLPLKHSIYEKLIMPENSESGKRALVT